MVLQIAPLCPDMLEGHTPVKLEAQEGKAFKHLSRMAFACVADVQQALVTLRRASGHLRGPEHHPPHPPLWPVGAPRPRHAPDQVVYQLDGVQAMRIAARQAHIDHQKGQVQTEQ
jgi:hypothetical protein